MGSTLGYHQKLDTLVLECLITPKSFKNKANFLQKLSVSANGLDFLPVDTSGINEAEDLRVVSDQGISTLLYLGTILPEEELLNDLDILNSTSIFKTYFYTDKSILVYSSGLLVQTINVEYALLSDSLKIEV